MVATLPSPPLRSPRFWGWLILGCWPPALAAWATGWDLVDPRYLGLLLLSWPLDVLGRLGALAVLLPRTARGPLQALAAALGAEVLLGLKLAGLALLGLLPALALLSLDHPGLRPWAWVAGALGLLPAALYGLRRLLALVWVLKEPCSASRALAAAAAQTKGRTTLFLRLAGPWLVLGLGLSLLDLGGGAWSLLLSPLAAACGLLGLAKAEAGLA